MNNSTNEEASKIQRPWVRLDGEDHDRSIDGFELFSARRALALLKAKLGRERLLELLHDEIEAGEEFLRSHLAQSAGREATGTTTLRAHGITTAQFTHWLARAFARQDVMLAGHPEHYSIHAEPGSDVNIVETLGDHVCSFFMREWDDSINPGQDSPAGAGNHPVGRRSHMMLVDGTVVGSIENAFADEADGFTARLSVTLPATCSPDVVEHTSSTSPSSSGPGSSLQQMNWQPPHRLPDRSRKPVASNNSQRRTPG